jgi:glycosyltransferase involved in cell wall biosynthesis
MHISINGRFLTQAITGVQRYGHALLDAIDVELGSRPDISATVFAPPNAPDMTSRWKNLKWRQEGRLTNNLWEQVELPFLAPSGVLFCPTNTAPLISLAGRHKVVITIHDLSFRYFPQAYSWSFRAWYNVVVSLAMHRATKVITVSEAERKAILEHFPSSTGRIVAIANGGWPGDNPPRSTLPRERNLVLYVGSFSKRKNFPMLFDVACEVAASRGYRFELVGGTAAVMARSDVEIPLAVRDLVTIRGQIDDIATLADCYSRATCFVFPSLYESSGLPPLEAMACGCPVVLSDLPALRERYGEAAVYCDPNSRSSIIEAVERVMDSLPLQDELRARGFARAAQVTWREAAVASLDVLEQAGSPQSR